MDAKKTRFTGVFVRESTQRRHHGRPDECYYITFKIGGKKKYEKVGWKSEGYTAAMASEIRSERLRELRHGNMRVVQSRRQEITFGQAWQLYYDHQLAPKKTSPRKHPDHSRYDNHLADVLGARPLSAISPFDLERLKSDLTKAGQSPQSVKHVLSLVRRVYRKMVAWDKWFGRIPTDRVEMPNFDNQRHRWLLPEEAKILLAEIRRRSLQWYTISLLSMHTGMRAGEIFGLSGEDLNMTSGEIRVKRSYKGKKKRARTVYLTATASAILLDLDIRPGRLVFLNRNDEKIKDVSETVPRSIDAIGFNDGIQDRLAKVVFHSFRHTFGSWLVQAGVPLYDVGQLMGHTEEETTERYGHLDPRKQKRHAQIIELMFNGTTPVGHTSLPDGLPGTLQHLFGGIQ